jgi:hypothetical protein
LAALHGAFRVYLQRLRQAVPALFDPVRVDLRARFGAAVEADLERTDAVEGGAMRVPRRWIFGRRGRVAELDRPGEDVVQAVGGAEGEARRAAFGNPPDIGSREAVSLLLENEDRGRVVDDIGHPLDGVPVLVRQHGVHGHRAEILLGGGQEDPAVPGHQVFGRAVERVDEPVQLFAACLRTTRIVGVIRQQVGYRFEAALQRLGVVLLPEVLDVVER